MPIYDFRGSYVLQLFLDELAQRLCAASQYIVVTVRLYHCVCMALRMTICAHRPYLATLHSSTGPTDKLLFIKKQSHPVILQKIKIFICAHVLVKQTR